MKRKVVKNSELIWLPAVAVLHVEGYFPDILYSSRVIFAGLAAAVLTATFSYAMAWRRVTPTKNLAPPPGWRLRRLAMWVFRLPTYERVLEPVLSDMQSDHFDALCEGRLRKARWVQFRGYWHFWSHFVLQMPVSLGKILMTLLR